MPVVIGASSTIPVPQPYAFVELKAPTDLWSAPWTPAPDLRVLSCISTAAGHDLGKAELEFRFGTTKQPWESAFSTTKERSYIGHWVRISLVGDGGTQPIWHGIIAAESRKLQAMDAHSAGIQTFVAYEPLHLLRRIDVSESHWLKVGVPDTRLTLGWMPPMNARGKMSTIRGNRSEGTYTEGGLTTALYGGHETWSNLSYLRYLLAWFVDARNTHVGGPAWEITGQYDALNDVAEVHTWRDVMTVAEMVRILIPRRYGIDYTIRPTAAGFAIDIFTLSADDWEFAGASLPRNPNVSSLRLSKSPEIISTAFVNTEEHAYEAVRVVGSRVVCCCTLRADAEPPSLIKAWTQGLEDLYVAGTGQAEDDGEDHDKARKRDALRPVFQHFAAPPDWDHNTGTAEPTVLVDGTLAVASTEQFQNSQRNTLPHLPLREGFDYASGTPLNNNPTEYEADFLAPLLFVKEQEEGRYVQSELATPSFGCRPLDNDLGIALNATPNHLVALNHFAGETVLDPEYDYSSLVATVAFETNHRLSLYHAIPFAVPQNGVKEIFEEDAELWYVAPSTVVGVTPEGVLIETPPAHNIELRNDSQHLGMIMAGFMARYLAERGRAEIVFRGSKAFGQVIGTILALVGTDAMAARFRSPITAVEWTFSGSPQTILRSGFGS